MLNLASLAGKSVCFRGRMGLDDSGVAWGWWVDNVSIYTCTGTHAISGNVGVTGATVGYGDTVLRTVIPQANGNYSFTVPHNWSGKVVPSHACYSFDPTEKVYSNVVTNLPAQDYDPTLVPGCADIDVLVGGAKKGRYGLSGGTSTRERYDNLNNGPLKLINQAGDPVVASQRVIYSGVSYSEMMGLPLEQLTTAVIPAAGH